MAHYPQKIAYLNDCIYKGSSAHNLFHIDEGLYLVEKRAAKGFALFNPCNKTRFTIINQR